MEKHKTAEEFLPYAKQSIDDDDLRAVAEALRSDFLTTGPRVAAFEREIARVAGARYAVACSSGTAALHLAVLALGLGPDDVLVTSPNTFLASANCARFTGASVAFADVEPGTANLDPDALLEVLSAHRGRVKVVVAVDFAGHPAELERIQKIAKEFGARVIEDAAHSLGASYGKYSAGCCAHTDLATFSFHPVKHVTTGEGGAVTTNDEALYEKLQLLRSHGMRRSGFTNDVMAKTGGKTNPWYYEMTELGYNYRITDIQCALGLSQIAKLGRFLERRRAIAAEYRRLLDRNAFVKPLEVRPGVEHAYHLFPVRVDYRRAGRSRVEVMEFLKQKGIGTQVHYIPVHLQPYYRAEGGTQEGDFPVAEKFYDEALSLPMYASMPVEGAERVVRALTECFTR